jgi:predicted DCC family thiol-disulfide oxidoreductase YuxK
MGVPYHATWGVCEKEGPINCDLDSDRALKTDIRPVDADAVLEALASMPIATWRYRTEKSRVRHVGPMAQDFRAAFGLGTSDRQIHVVDASGVTMVALQALHKRVQRLEQQNRALQQKLQRLGYLARSAR